MKIAPKSIEQLGNLLESDDFKNHCTSDPTAVAEVVKAALAINDLSAITEIVILLMSICTIREFSIFEEAVNCKEGKRVAFENTLKYVNI